MSAFEGGRGARSLIAAGLLAAGVCLAGPGGSAWAQAWDWGGGERKVASSGKEIGSFDPSVAPGQIIVSFSDRLIYFVTRQGEALSYPIAIPREQDDWQGVMRVSDKRVNPSWTPTPTMIRENPRLPSWVPGGHPMNPMGVRALYLGSSAYRIHGTDAPWTIGQPVSKGCIRMYNQDVIDLYDRVKLGAKVTVTWDSFLDGTRKVIDHAAGASMKPDRTQAAASRQPTTAYALFSEPPPERPIGKRRDSRPVPTTAQEKAAAEAAAASKAQDADAPRARHSGARPKSARHSDEDSSEAKQGVRGKDSPRAKAAEKAKSTATARQKKQSEQRADMDLGAMLFR